MKKNLYYRSVVKRSSLVKDFCINLFIGSSSLPRLLLEVFIRKNFGDRYFAFSPALVLAFALGTLPLLLSFIRSWVFSSYLRSSFQWGSFFLSYTSWYLFLSGFVYMSILRKRELKQNPSVFDFQKISTYSGDINPWFYTLRIFGKTPDIRLIETLLEPALFFAIGFVLILFGQSVGTLILICSLFYSLGNIGSYYIGDNFVMDKIDEMIHNEEMYDAFVKDKDASETRGVRFYGRKPADENIRGKIVESFFEEEPVFEAH